MSWCGSTIQQFLELEAFSIETTPVDLLSISETINFLNLDFNCYNLGQNEGSTSSEY